MKIPGKTSTHIRFNGIAALGESGFANPLNPNAANGPLEFINCIADMNTMNGVGFHGTGGLRVSQLLVPLVTPALSIVPAVIEDQERMLRAMASNRGVHMRVGPVPASSPEVPFA